MPRALKTDKFFLGAIQKSGRMKGKRLLSFNYAYSGDTSKINLQDMIDFLKEKGVEPSSVEVPRNFITSTNG
ncbi:MAG: hypothetical protein WC827_04255 [Candidatus Paceibacterota bacterium]|jgi:hypothetical protein